jgi:rhodanese-related sulfurtransferase
LPETPPFVFPAHRETRSLKACYELLRAGYSNVVHCGGGLSEWNYRKYDVESLT